MLASVRALSSAGERSLHTGEVVGSIPTAPTIAPTTLRARAVVCERPSAQRPANGRSLSSARPHPDIFRALRAPARGKDTELSAAIPERDSQPVATSHRPLAGTKLSANKSESIPLRKRPARTDQHQSNRLLRRGVQSIERLAKSASRKPCSGCRMASQCFWFLESLGKAW